MSCIDLSRQPCKLSICISTRNRADFIGATLDAIIAQVTNECEIVVLDGASTDDTERVVSGYALRFEHFRYFRQETNTGPERGFNEAVELAQGEYCWLVPDDDLLKPGAVAAILEALHRDYSLVIVNAEYRDPRMLTVLAPSLLQITSDREFVPADMDELFATCWNLIRYLGSIVIKRNIWLSREREKYYGSYWVQVGVIFQKPLPGTTLVMVKPCMSVRIGNQTWLSKWFQIFQVNWPSLVQSFPLSESVKSAACAEELWRRLEFLLLVRASGGYTLAEYKQHIRPRTRSLRENLSTALIAILPRVTLNTCLVLYYSVFGGDSGLFGRGSRQIALGLLAQSRFRLRRRRACAE